jgi:hypothetical protein
MPAAALKVRNLRPGESLPPDIKDTGFEEMPLNPRWIWVLERRGRIVAMAITINAHGFLILLRTGATPKAPPHWPLVLFPQVFAEAKARGCKGYYTFLDDRQPAEVKLMRIVLRIEGALLPAYGAWAVGSFLKPPWG